MKLLHHN